MILPRTYAHFLMSIKIPFMRFFAAVWPELLLPLAPLRRPCSNDDMEPTLPSERDDAQVAPRPRRPPPLQIHRRPALDLMRHPLPVAQWGGELCSA